MDNELDALERQPVADGVSQSALIRPLGLRWQTEPPKVPGWYWVRYHGVSVREFDQTVIDQLTHECDTPQYDELLRRMNFAWAGPIPEPAEAP